MVRELVYATTALSLDWNPHEHKGKPEGTVNMLCLLPWMKLTQAPRRLDLPAFLRGLGLLFLGGQGRILEVIGEEVERAVGHIGQLLYGR